MYIWSNLLNECHTHSDQIVLEIQSGYTVVSEGRNTH